MFYYKFSGFSGIGFLNWFYLKTIMALFPVVKRIDSTWYDMIKELLKVLPLDTCNWLPIEEEAPVRLLKESLEVQSEWNQRDWNSIDVFLLDLKDHPIMFWRGTHGRISEPLGLKHFGLITKKKKERNWIFLAMFER